MQSFNTVVFSVSGFMPDMHGAANCSQMEQLPHTFRSTDFPIVQSLLTWVDRPLHWTRLGLMGSTLWRTTTLRLSSRVSGWSGMR